MNPKGLVPRGGTNIQHSTFNIQRPTTLLRVLRTLLCVMAMGVVGGCLFEKKDGPLPPPVLPPPGEGPADSVELAVYFLSLPADRAAGRFAADYWRGADENVVAPDVGALWRANGFRLGLVKAEVVRKVADIHRTGGATCSLRRLRVRHGRAALLAASQSVPRATFLITLPGRRTAVRTFARASVALQVTCRVVDDETAYVEMVPKLLQPGRRTGNDGRLDFLTTEMAVRRSQGVLVGLGSLARQTVGRALLTSGRDRNRTERLIVIAAEPVCLGKQNVASGE